MSVFHYYDARRREHLDLYYEDDMIALDTTRVVDGKTLSGHEVMLPREAVNDLIQHLTIMRDTISIRFPQLAITAKEPKS